MSAVRKAMAAVWDFVIGDDWVAAAGVIAALGATAVLPDDLPTWLLVPVAAIGLLWVSVRRFATAASR